MSSEHETIPEPPRSESGSRVYCYAISGDCSRLAQLLSICEGQQVSLEQAVVGLARRDAEIQHLRERLLALAPPLPHLGCQIEEFARLRPGLAIRHRVTGRRGVIASERDQQERGFANEWRVLWGDGRQDRWEGGRGFLLEEDLLVELAPPLPVLSGGEDG